MNEWKNPELINIMGMIIVYFSLFSNNIHTVKCYSAVKFNYVITSAVLFYKEKEISHSKYFQSISL